MAEDIECSLPDTQTQTQGSQIEWSQNTPVICNVWGRLFPTKSNPTKSLGINKRSTFDNIQAINTFIDLSDKQFKVGRAIHCDFVVKKEVFKEFVNNVSKEHFVITRETSDPSSPVIIHDLSSNGTFVNGEKIGKDKKRILCSKDEISLSHAKAKLFVFVEVIERERPIAREEITNKYFISKVLGTGACGVVRLVYNKITCEKFAMKIIAKKKLSNTQKHNKSDNESVIMNEVNILKALKHPSIISTEEVFDFPEMVCIVLEFMCGGELFDRVSSMGKLDEHTAKIIFRQMVLAVSYLHEQGIAHRDLKPENVLLASTDVEPLVKLTDFGLSKLVGEESFMRTMCGTPLYVAPEVLLAEGISTYGQQVDVWSLGVILFICLCGYLPFSQEYKGMSLREQIIKGCYMFSKKHWEGVSLEARTLVLRMLNVNPSKRISINRILQDKWMMDDKVIQRVEELMENSSCTSECRGDDSSVCIEVCRAMKRVLSEDSHSDNQPTAKRRKTSDDRVTPAITTPSTSSDDTVEELSVESISFK